VGVAEPLSFRAIDLRPIPETRGIHQQHRSERWPTSADVLLDAGRAAFSEQSRGRFLADFEVSEPLGENVGFIVRAAHHYLHGISEDSSMQISPRILHIIFQVDK